MPVSRSSHLGNMAADQAARLLRVRWVVRAPVWAYRARLGMMFGSRLLMLEHTGRKTGVRRHVVLEVLDRPDSGTWIVASGFGARAQWYRNVLVTPQVRIYAGSQPPVPAVARQLAPEEATATLDRYAARHPRAWTALRPVLEASLGAPISDHGTNLPLVAFQLSPQSSPPD